ncbi:hypothetical protein AMECASPLE_032823 [Ameca splendens]|uniref:LRP chaperone MESD n=1 Tax=Ameca splendens TaxID=208324 RepID=A0ABV0ZRJ4_9TELE
MGLSYGPCLFLFAAARSFSIKTVKPTRPGLFFTFLLTMCRDRSSQGKQRSCLTRVGEQLSAIDNTGKPKKKDIRDYNDADMARLLEQWEKDDDIEEGDLPEHRRSPPPIDFSKVDPTKPEDLLKMSKKGRTLMVFATVSGDPTEKETEEITGLWQGSLFNANYDVQR